MWTAERVEEALGAELDTPTAALLGTLAPTLARLFNRDIKAEAAQAELAQAVPLFKALAGKKIERDGAVLDFRDTTILGSVSLHDIAGGDITKITINLGGATFAIGEVTAYFETELRLVKRLGPVYQVALVEVAARTLGINPLDSGIDPVFAIARALTRTDFTRLTDFAGQFAILDCTAAQEIVDIAAPFCWISRDATAVIPKVPLHPPGQRGIGINASLPRTARTYLAAAPMPPQKYIAVEAGGRNSDDLLGELTDGIYEAVGAAVGCTADDCRVRLATLPLNVFVILPGEAPDADLLDQLRARFPTLTFVVLTRELGQAGFAALGLLYVDYLLPELGPGDEDSAWTQVDDAKLMARCAAN